MRRSSSTLIYIDVQKALDAGLKFYLSANGVVLTEGDKDGYIRPEFFARVQTAAGKPVPGWEPSSSTAESVSASHTMAQAILDPILHTAQAFLFLLLVIEVNGDRVVAVVNFITEPI